MTREQFTNAFFQMAINASKGTPIFPDTVITAAGLESGWNTSKLSLNDNNFFGFKSSPSWNGDTVTYPTTEYINGKATTVWAEFRKYPSAEDSFKDYVRLLQTTRYVNAGVTTAKTPEQQFAALQKAGYATDPNYANKLTSVLNTIKSFFVDSSTYIKNVIADNPKISAAAGVGLIAVIVVLVSIFLAKKKSFK